MRRMAMGKRTRHRQLATWVMTTDLPTPASHPFYRRLNQLLREHGFDDFVEAQCAGFTPRRWAPAGVATRHLFPVAPGPPGQGYSGSRGSGAAAQRAASRSSKTRAAVHDDRRLRAFESWKLRSVHIETRVRGLLDRWRSLLSTTRVEDDRRLLRDVLSGPIRMTPEGRSYRCEGEATFGGQLAGNAALAPFVVAVRGFEPRSRG